ncbi:hypothetical protein QEZ52_13770 [Aliisedimentitalea scapharcae]|uniref:Uncharacterized protein n=1 Tax=Aliisedimentitalea scapharcae TaxID=1524259 RepID=A0ABZ2XPP3_9RHOB|nr:hypothetical protein K3727_13675 [Rhodobacteraceae bacterium M382]
MFGVVLWSDTDERKAVIWCEDHGDLAFYKQNDQEPELPLDAGDWVQFDLTMERHMRYAHNPRLVSEGLCSGLADVLGAEQELAPVQPAAQELETGSAKIIPFAAAQKRRNATDSSVARILA